jgi:hypothetical protein
MIFLTWFYCNPPEAFVNPFPPRSGRGAGKPRKRAENDQKVAKKDRNHYRIMDKVGE